MPSDGRAEAALDFSRRARLSEWMDEPCSYEEFRACLRDLAQVNRLTLADRPTKIWLTRLVRHARAKGLLAKGQSLRIIDVGSGQGDMLRALALWGRRLGVRLEMTGIDLNPYAARAAAEESRSGETIRWVTGDAFSFSDPEGADVILSSLFTHHLADAEIVRFLTWMEATARLGWFVNDLERGAIPYFLFVALSRVAGWHRFVQHDGPVSIRRSFRSGDWQDYLTQAGLGAVGVRVERFRPARLCVGRIR